MIRLSLVLALCLAAPLAQAKPAACRSWQGMEVPYQGDATLADLGGATQDKRGRPLIEINPDLLSTYPPLAREFLLAHECGHHALTPNYNTEAEADCHAMRKLRKKLVRTPEQLAALQEELRTLPEDAWTGHRPDAARIDALALCGEE